MQSWTREILSPFNLGSVALRNRVVLPGHTTNFARSNRPTDKYSSYLAERARGGVGLIITEGIRVHPTSAGRHISLGSFDDESVSDYAAVASAVHDHDTKIFAQLLHAGRQANGDATRTAAWAPSPIAWSPGAYRPHAMGQRDIHTVVGAFGDAARRMKTAGFDGIELHLGHGHLLQQFLSPATNLRTDKYGGSLDNRLRFVREIMTAIVDRVPEFPIGFRVSADEFLPKGLQPDDVIDIVNRLAEIVEPVYVNVSHSAYHASWSLATQIADMAFPHAPFINHARLFKQGCPDFPVLAVCRLDSLKEAAEVLAKGDADLVGLVRPQIADPNLVLHAQEGHDQAGRSCLACNQACIQRVEQNLPISCVVNPEVGFEREWSETRTMVSLKSSVNPKTKVLVVGGGPAGMSAALAADDAGCDVTLMESGSELGGQFKRASSVPGRERLGLLIKDSAAQLGKSKVKVLLGTTADETNTLQGGWDHIILATGSTPSQRFNESVIPALDIWSAADLAAGTLDLPEGDIVLVDDEGSITGSSLAESIAQRGRIVHIVSSGAALASRVTTYSRLALVKRLADLGVQVHLLASVKEIGSDHVSLIGPYQSSETKISNVAAVIDAGSADANDSLFRFLDGSPSCPQLHVIGDANSPRTAFESVFEGRLVGTFLGDLSSEPARRIASIA